VKIKRSGFVYRCAYGLMDKDARPSTVNLCPLFWKFVFMFLLGWWFFFLSYMIGCVIIVIIYVFGFFFAARPTIFKGEENILFPMMHYTTWPTTPNGKRIWPIWFVLGGLAIWLAYAKRSVATSAVIDLAASLAAPTAFWNGFGMTATCFILFSLGYKFLKSESWLLFRFWCRAKKEKVCPIIEVVD